MQTRLLIGGDWLAGTGGGEIEVENPATEAVITTVAAGTPADATAACDAAAETQPAWAATAPRERAEILRAAARRVPLSEEVDLTALAAELEGFSSADCAALIREAALAAMRESLTATQVGLAHIEAARRRVRPSLDPVQVAALQAYAERHQIR